MITEIKKDDVEHLKLLNNAINNSDLSSLSNMANRKIV